MQEDKQKPTESGHPSILTLTLALIFGASLHLAVSEYQVRAALSATEDDGVFLTHKSTGSKPTPRSSSPVHLDSSAATSSDADGKGGAAKRYQHTNSGSGRSSSLTRPNGRPLGWPGQHRPKESTLSAHLALPPLAAEWPVPEEAHLFRELVEAKSTIDWAPVVAGQLVQWKVTGYTQRQVDEYCVRKVVVASFVKNEFRVKSFNTDHKNMHRLRCGFWLMKAASIRAAARGTPIPDVEVAVLSGDSAFSLSTPKIRWDDAGPLLSNIKCGDASVSIPMTLSDMFGSGDGTMGLALYAKMFAKALDWSGDKSWETLENVAFFSAGGGATTRGNRSHLFDISKDHGEFLNATPHARGMEVMSNFRYNVYAYGHCGWSRRIKELAMLRTVVLVEESSCNEYIHGLFRPNVDHLPVNEDFSDLVDTMEKAVPQGKAFEGNAMAEEWVARGQEMMTLTSTLDYVELLLRGLAKLQRFVPQYHPEWKEYTFGRGRLWFGSLKQRNDTRCTKPHFHSRPRTHKC